MDGAGDQGDRRGEAYKPPERKTSRPRAEGSPPPGAGPTRQGQDARRRRGNEQRYVAFGDGIERVFCARARHPLPATFPVESHAGAATIPATVVARRAGALLICTFSHCGEHIWPDGEIVDAGTEPVALPNL